MVFAYYIPYAMNDCLNKIGGRSSQPLGKEGESLVHPDEKNKHTQTTYLVA